MPIDPTKKTSVRVTVPKDIHQELKEIAQKRGISMSQLFLQAAIQAYLPDRLT